MRHVLASSQRVILRALARTRSLLVFDFDGTLAPIVADPSRASPTPRTLALLRAVSVNHPCAVISGRARADVAPRLPGVELAAIVGNHGAELAPGRRGLTSLIRRAKVRLTRELGGEPGIVLEDKGLSLAIHHRHASDQVRATARIEAALRSLPTALRAFGGHRVVNVVPADAPNKGDALLRLRAEVGAERALYVGDDVTDEDVFRLGADDGLVSVRVGVSRASAARLYVHDRDEVDLLIAVLLALGAEARGVAPRRALDAHEARPMTRRRRAR